jgi:hypothetical protein
MDDLDSTLKRLIAERLPDDRLLLGNELIDAVCGAIDLGADSDGVSDAVEKVLEAILADAEAALTKAEAVIRENRR